MRQKLYIVGVGPGNRECLSGKAAEILRSVDRLLATPRVAELHERCESLSLSDLIERLKRPFQGTTAVLVGGDCGFFSAASTIVRDGSQRYEIERISGIGSISYFSSRIGIRYDDACLLSFHGRDDRIVPYVAYNKKTFALTGGSVKAGDLCGELDDAGLSNVDIVVGEKLSYPDERIVRGTPKTLKNETFDDLSVVYMENGNAADPHAPIRDDEFIRSEESAPRVPMTKEEVRWLTLSKLAPSPKDILYDIGAGTGSVSVEAARKAFQGAVYAIERRDDACRLIEKNRIRHGAYNVTVKQGKAPDCFADLPIPDKAFLGGGSGEIESVVESLLRKNPALRLVANAVTLQSLNRLLETFNRFGLSDVETICVNIAKSERINSYEIMTARNPVYIVSGNGAPPCES